ncbi:hypothetical protein Tco_0615718 [Tanacetum coccineum]
MSKLLYTHFTKLIIDYILSQNKSIPYRSDFKLHSSQDDHPITKLLSITNGDYKFGMEVPDAMINDAIKKKAGYTYYMAKKVESKKARIVDKPKEKHVSLVKSGRGKGFMCYADQLANVPNKLKKDGVPRKTRSLTIIEEAVVGEGSSAAHNKYYPSSNTASDATLYYSSSDKSEESANETDDAGESNMDLSDDNPHRYDDAARYSSNIILMQEMFPGENAHHIPSLPAKKIPYLTTTPQPNSLQAKAKKLIQKAKKNMRKINFKKAEAQKFREYDHKLEALTNFNVSEAFEKAVQAKVLTEIKKLIPTHIPNAIANYVRPRLNTSMLEVMKTNQINLFTQSSTSTNDLLDMDLKIKLLNRIHLNKSNKTHTTHQQLYDTLCESITLDQDALDAQAAQSSFHKRSHDNQDPSNNHEGENKKKRRKDVGKPSFRSSSDEGDVSKPRSFERHMSKSTKPHPCFYNNDYTYLVDLNTEEKYTTSITKHYVARYYKEVRSSDNKEYEFSYADLPRLSVNDVEDITMIKNRVEDIQLGVESYQRTLNLTKPTMFFEGIDQRIPFTMTATHKGSIKENMIDMLSKNKLGSSNKRLKGRDWTDYDVKSSKEMLKKIDEILRHIEQLRRLEE